jgi:hypothetical protein
MIVILNIITNFVLSKYYIGVTLIILSMNLNFGKMASRYVANGIEEAFSSNFEVVDKLILDSINDKKLSDKLYDYYNTLIKSRLYFVLALSLVFNIIVIIFSVQYDITSLNVLLVTLIISIIEYRDNRYLSKKLYKEYENMTNELISEYIECKNMAIDDFVNELNSVST